MLDDLERALEAAEEHEEAKLEEGVRLVHRSLAETLERRGSTRSRRTGSSTRTSTRRCSRSRPRREEGAVVEVVQKGYRLGDRVLRPARVVVAVGRARSRWRTAKRPLRDARRRRRTPRRTRSRRRTGSSRASTTRTRTRGQRRPRSASRRSRAPTTCSRTRRSASSTTASARPNGARARSAAAVDFDGFDFGDLGDLGDLFGGLFGGARRRAPALRSAASAAATSRRGQPLVRGLAEAASRRRSRSRLETACRTCGGSGAEPGTAPGICPECNGRGVIVREPGAVRALAAVPALPRQRHRDRGAVPDVPRLGPRAAHEALHGEDPGRRKDGTRIRLKGKGEAGLRRRPGGRPLRRHARRAVDAVRAPRRRPRRRRAGHVRGGGARRARSRCRRPDGPVSLKVPAGSQDGKLLRVQGPRRAEAEGRRQGRPARAREARPSRRS